MPPGSRNGEIPSTRTIPSAMRNHVRVLMTASTALERTHLSLALYTKQFYTGFSRWRSTGYKIVQTLKRLRGGRTHAARPGVHLVGLRRDARPPPVRGGGG